MSKKTITLPNLSTDLVRTRVLIISDTHLAQLEEPGAYGPFLPFQKPLPAADVLIHCGDLTRSGTLDEFRTALDMLREIDVPTKLVIAGNHDLLLDREYMHRHHLQYGLDLEQAEELWIQARHFWTAPDGPAAQAGVTFLDEGHHQIDLSNGARLQVYASPYTPEFCDFGFPYTKHEDRFNHPKATPQGAANIAVHPVRSFPTSTNPIDIMITHGPPSLRLDLTIRHQHVGCPHLLRAVMDARPLIHCFGHIHEASGAEIITWVRNADLMATKPIKNEALVLDAWRRGLICEQGLIKDLTPRAAVGEVKRSHGVEVDISQISGDHVRRGLDTLMVNAAIMNARNRPENPPWLIHVDLPKALLSQQTVVPDSYE